jgi:hypothetical protein
VRSGGRSRWPADLLCLGSIGAAIALVYGPSATNPLRLWDHHAILLLAKAPQFAEGLFWRLFHYRVGFQEDVIFFRVLSMPSVYAMARAFGDTSELYHAMHLAAHFAVTVVFYCLVRAISRQPTVALLFALLFGVYSGHSDTVNIPHYIFMFGSMLLGGLGLIQLMAYIRSGGRRTLVLAAACVALATLFYDALFLLAISLPLIGVAVRWQQGVLRAPERATAGAILLGQVSLFIALMLSLRFSPAASGGTVGTVHRSLEATVMELLGDARIPRALFYGAWAVASDVLLFVTGHSPEVWHRGNMPYWLLESVRAQGWRALAALAVMIVGLAAARALSWPGRVVGVALVAAGTAIDPRVLPLAVIVGILWMSGIRPPIDATLAVITGAGLLVAFNIALGRADGYNVVALRHHYVTGFFVLAALAYLVGARWRERPRWQRCGLLAAASACVVFNAGVTLRMQGEVKKNNEMVFSFDRALTTMAERHGPGSLFVSFSTSVVRGHDWHTSPAQDVVFDVLHYHHNPMTRYVSRAPFRVNTDGVVTANPAYGRPTGDDFAFRFTLTRIPAGRLELFGSSPKEPRIVLEGDRVTFLGRRRGNGTGVEWSFRFPPDSTLPVVVALARRGASLEMAVNGRSVGAHVVADRDAYHQWESDNVGLLGRDFEKALTSYAMYETFMRIGADGAEDVS